MELTEIEKLVKSARKGSDRSFNKLVDVFNRQVFHTALSVLGDYDLAEDVSQEVFVKVYNSLHTLREPKRFPSWIKTIARNRALSYYRKISRRSEVTGLPSLDVIPESTIVNPMEIEDTTQRREELLRCIQGLPEIQRKLLLLKYVENMSVDDISKAEDLSSAAIRNHLYRARKLLRGMIQT